MNKNKRSILTSVISVFILLIGLLSLVVKPTTAYFTSGENYQIQTIVNISLIEYKVYQVDALGAEREIKRSNDSSITATDYVEIESDSNYVCVEPDVLYTLRLKLRNEDDGNSSMGVKFKIEFYACGIDQSGESDDTLLNVTLSGIDSAGVSSAGFYLSGDGYYHYVNNSSSHTDIEFIGGNTQTTGVFMMTGFTIPFSEFANLNGTSLRININIQGFEIV